MITDFHTHILPEVDDGSSSLEESLAMLRMEAEQGIGRVIATPHFYPWHDNPKAFLDRRDRAEERLREAMSHEPGMPELLMGAEVHFFSGMSDSNVLLWLTNGSKRCILLEMPHAPWSDRMYSEIESIYTKHDIVPVIAHVDRYISPFRTHGIPERLEQLPVMVQANAGFFLHPATRRMAIRMLKRNQIHVLGSDCHNLETR